MQIYIVLNSKLTLQEKIHDKQRNAAEYIKYVLENPYEISHDINIILENNKKCPLPENIKKELLKTELLKTFQVWGIHDKSRSLREMVKKISVMVNDNFFENVEKYLEVDKRFSLLKKKIEECKKDVKDPKPFIDAIEILKNRSMCVNDRIIEVEKNISFREEEMSIICNIEHPEVSNVVSTLYNTKI